MNQPHNPEGRSPEPTERDEVMAADMDLSMTHAKDLERQARWQEEQADKLDSVPNADTSVEDEAAKQLRAEAAGARVAAERSGTQAGQEYDREIVNEAEEARRVFEERYGDAEAEPTSDDTADPSEHPDAAINE